MANLSITARCNRKCSYCFAMESLDEMPSALMSMELYERGLNFLQRSGQQEARLLGGEPTIHPKFVQMVDGALDRGMNLLIFSGGLIPPRALEKIAEVPEARVRLLINVVPPGGEQREIERQRRVYRLLGRKVVLGLNIDRPGVPLDFMLELIVEYDLDKVIRLGLAHPIHGGSNDYLHPREYPEVGRRVADFGFRAKEQGVGIEFDCGWVPCMFPPGALEVLGKGPNDVGLRCTPILDALTDGRMISCYALSGHASLPLPDEHDAGWARSYFDNQQTPDRAFMLYQECQTCDWRARGECTGGCLAGSMKRLRATEFSVTVPISALTEKREGQIGKAS